MADIKVYGTLRTMAIDGIVATADQLKDTNVGKFQEEINHELAGGMEGKQDTIEDLEQIRSLSNSAVQPSVLQAAIADFITKSVNDLVNYYKKSETYTKAEVNGLIGAIKQFTYRVVSSLPTASESTMYIIYLIPSSNASTQNVKDEFITIQNGSSYSWEQIGSTKIDLSGYSTTEEMNAAITSALNTALSDYYDKTATDHLLAAKANTTDLENGTIVPKLATNLESWEGREDLTVNTTFSEPVRTTAGDASIVSSKGGKIVSIVPRSDFYASALKATGFNLLRNAVQIGTTTKYYFLVPKLIFGTFGTADEPNGILFTNAQGEKMTPTVYFKKLSDGVPTSSSYGSACTYTTSNGYRFYTCSEIGYMVVDGVTLASTCAHIAWSRRYDEYKAIDAADDAGSSISLAAIFTALHAANQPALFITNEVRDFIEFTNTTAVWHRVCNKTTVSTWTNTEIPSEGGGASTYIHSASISGMKSGGVARIESTMLTVEGTTVSFTDGNATAASADVVYELATQASGTVSITPTYSLEDWGLEYLEGATGTAEVTTQYCRNYPDSLAALAQFDFKDLSLVVGETLAELFYDIQGIKSNMKRYTEMIDEYGYPMRMGQRVFDLTDGAPTEIPMSLGLVRLDASTGHMWVSKGLTISTNDWKQVQ